ncbi:MAG: MarR family transcriptional regulator [Pseudomonadota bacterium]
MSNRYYIPDEEATGSIVFLINEISRKVRNETAAELRRHNLYPGQENLLGLLAAEGALTPSAIATSLGVRPPTITKTISRLEGQGFVEKTSSNTDRRQVTISLTKQGEKVIKAMNKVTRKVEKSTVTALKKKERKQLIETLHTLRDHLDAGNG